MKKSKPLLPVVIVGGGPVGLFLAILLHQKGIPCKVLEMRKDPVPDSRSLGIHPVSMELFDDVGIAERFISDGIKIKRGFAHTGKKKLGEISFEDGKKPYNYILACPQFTTEKILREELNKMDSSILNTEAKFVRFIQSDEQISIIYIDSNGVEQTLPCRYLVGCDGKNSMVRQQASIHYSGKHYPDTYIMGDFQDTTQYGEDAVVFLPKNGLIECFPMPNEMRRWVVKTESYIHDNIKSELLRIVKDRLNHDLSGIESTMISSFGVQHFIAEDLSVGNVILAGDAAHIVSPIGGQGMNLGWLDCHQLSKTLHTIMKNKYSDKNKTNDLLNKYSKRQKKITTVVARRAELNMIMGRKYKIPILRDLAIRFMLSGIMKQKTIKMFTMRGLG